MPAAMYLLIIFRTASLIDALLLCSVFLKDLPRNTVTHSGSGKKTVFNYTNSQNVHWDEDMENSRPI
jgi:hypothetical protein